MIIEQGDADEILDLDKAREVGDTLNKHYPHHPWLVAFQGRVLIVRHMAINEMVKKTLGRDGFGFVLKHLDSSSAKDLSHSAMIAGGQLLEAFGLKRGAWDGSLPVVPESWSRNTMRNRTLQ